MKNRNNQPIGFKMRKGFSLIEMAFVLAILTALSALSIPAFSNMVKAGKVSEGTGLVAGYIEMARLAAGTHSRPVEVRFYQKGGPGGGYLAMQLYILKDSGMEALTPVVQLPDGVAIAGDERSSLLAEPGLATGNGSGISASWSYRSFEISPTGETTLPLGGPPLCLALGEKRVLEASSGSAPGLAAVFVDAMTGKARVAGK